MGDTQAEEKEAKKLEQIITSVSPTDEQLKRVLLRIKKPELEFPTDIQEFSKKAVTFLIVGDLHLNAYESTTRKKLCDFKKFREVLHIGKEEGAQYVIQTGDVADGEQMRPEQKYNLVVQGFDNVIEYSANEWPDSGLMTYFIAGNHDQTYKKVIDADICKYIARERKDLVYLGMNEGNLPLQPEFIEQRLQGKKIPAIGPTWIRIRHPAKGTAKGQSYQPQAHVEVLHSDKKPRILIIGHYHKMDYLFERNVHAFQAGTMERQSDWMRTHDLTAHLGAWLVKVFYRDDGTVDGIQKRKLLYEVNGDEQWGFIDERGVYEGR